MKNLRLFFAFTASIIIYFNSWCQIGNSEALYQAGLMRYPKKSGLIIYEISGGDVSGKAQLTFDQGGWLEQTERNFAYTLYGMKNEVSTLEGQDGDVLYTIDFKSMKGAQTINKTESDLMKYKIPDEVRSAIFTAKGGAYAGDTTLMGKTVKIWRFQNSNPLEIWEAEGLVLYQKRKLGSIIYSQVAIAIEELVNPITIPENIEWKINE